MFYVVGIDASLTGLGLVAIPGDWACDLSRVLYPRRADGMPAILATEADEGPLPERRRELAQNVVEWVGWLQRKPNAVVNVWLEGGIANKRDMGTLRSQERLAGAIEDALWYHLGIESSIAEQSSSRKLLLGYLPAENRKETVVDVLSKLAPGWNHNVYDALCAANWGMQFNGAAHLADLAPPKPVKPMKPRRAKGQVAFA